MAIRTISILILLGISTVDSFAINPSVSSSYLSSIDTKPTSVWYACEGNTNECSRFPGNDDGSDSMVSRAKKDDERGPEQGSLHSNLLRLRQANTQAEDNKSVSSTTVIAPSAAVSPPTSSKNEPVNIESRFSRIKRQITDITFGPGSNAGDGGDGGDVSILPDNQDNSVDNSNNITGDGNSNNTFTNDENNTAVCSNTNISGHDNSYDSFTNHGSNTGGDSNTNSINGDGNSGNTFTNSDDENDDEITNMGGLEAITVADEGSTNGGGNFDMGDLQDVYNSILPTPSGFTTYTIVASGTRLLTAFPSVPADVLSQATAFVAPTPSTDSLSTRSESATDSNAVDAGELSNEPLDELPSRDISTNSKIVIGVSVPLGLMISIVLLLVYFRCRKRSHRQRLSITGSRRPTSVYSDESLEKVESKKVCELYGAQSPKILDGTGWKGELEAPTSTVQSWTVGREKRNVPRKSALSEQP